MKDLNKKKEEGYSTQEILYLETKNNIVFPASYKEFLLNKGRCNIYRNDIRAGVEPKILEEMQKDAQFNLDEDNFIIKGKYWSFADYNRGEQFFFFYLNQEKDPSVYTYYLDYKDGTDKPTIEKIAESFTNYIEHIYKN